MQGELKGMILSSLLKGEKDSNSIFNDVTANETEINMPDGTKEKFNYKGTLNNIRVDILYLRRHKYIRILNKKRPYTYALTSLGKRGADNPFAYLEYREKVIKKALESKTEELKSQFEDRVKAEVESRIEAEIKKIHDSNLDIIAQRAKEYAHEVLHDKDGKFRNAVREKALEQMTQILIPRGTKLFVGTNNTIELNMTPNPKYPYPLVVVVENGRIKDSYQKK